jgi:hypothetical protein
MRSSGVAAGVLAWFSSSACVEGLSFTFSVMNGSYKFIAMRHQWGWPAKSQARMAIFFNYFFEV